MHQSVIGQREDEIQRVRRTRIQVAQRRTREWNRRLLAAIRDGQIDSGELDCSEAVIERIRKAPHIGLIADTPRVLVAVPPRAWEEGMVQALSSSEGEPALDRTSVERLAWDLVQMIGQCVARCPAEVASITGLSESRLGQLGLADFHQLARHVAESGMSLRQGHNVTWWSHALRLAALVEAEAAPQDKRRYRAMLGQFLMLNDSLVRH